VRYPSKPGPAGNSRVPSVGCGRHLSGASPFWFSAGGLGFNVSPRNRAKGFEKGLTPPPLECTDEFTASQDFLLKSTPLESGHFRIEVRHMTNQFTTQGIFGCLPGAVIGTFLNDFLHMDKVVPFPSSGCRRWRLNPSGKCSQERRLTRGTVTSTMRRAAHPSGCARCGAGAGCSAIKTISSSVFYSQVGVVRARCHSVDYGPFIKSQRACT